MNPDLPSIEVRTFFHNLLPAQAETISGGATVVDLSNIQDGINTTSNSLSMLSVSSNKLFTFDLSRITINLVMVWPEGEPSIFSWFLE